MHKTILILTANPRGTTPLALETEVREIRESLRLSSQGDRWTLEHRTAVRWKDVRRELEEIRPEIVHFSGHGTGAEGLVLEGDDSSSHLISADALKRCFALFSVDCVVLNACYAQVQAEAIHAHVPCVIGMNRAIGDRAARRFAEAFYDGIGAGRAYPEAFQLGLSGIANDQEVWTPVLLYRDPSVPFGVENVPQPTESLEVAPTRQIELEEPGGKMAIASPFYIPRPPAEEDALKEVMRVGTLVRIKAPREFGKSSLMARVVEAAESEGMRTVAINFREIDREFLGSLGGFLKYFCAQLTRKLRFENRLPDYWESGLGSKGDCGEYFEDYLLPQIGAGLVLELDEVDLLFEEREGGAWPIDFFSMLRAWYEKGRTHQQWQKLRLVLVHSKDFDHETLQQSQSPFNVGLEIELPELSEAQGEALAVRHGLEAGVAIALMPLVGGHPQLLRVGLYAIARGRCSLENLLTEGATEAGLYGRHLQHCRSSLERHPEWATAFRRVLASEAGVAIALGQGAALRSLGLVKPYRNVVQVSCELYRQYFGSVGL